jgi:hypothetical protein
MTTMTDTRRDPIGVDRFFCLSFFIAAMMVANIQQPASATPRTGWFTPACAKQDLRALSIIEERGEMTSAPVEQLADAGLKFLQARLLCLSGREDEGVALYESIIEIDVPALNGGKANERARR